MKRFIYLLISMLFVYGVWTHWLKPNKGIEDHHNDQIVNEQIKTFDQFTIENLSAFEGEFRVLSREDYSMGREAEISPVDFALGWGRMAEPQIYKQLSIRQSNRWYYWRYENTPPIDVREIETHSANMHMIPANKDIAKQLSKVQKDDLIYLKGHLVEVRAQDGWIWRSSLTREDTGNGACELFLIEDMRIMVSS
ncbi:hypothetical protein [Acinetobacter rongchengensis]|uniref:Uncharacterized protein n=1 Tax=Acinetobacter rongchengensis TaxID=2419601 RepID=A0A3A8EVF5_9GAMM|nr:hypothetical protein [Acinetobacter rongchengensis]RKG38595.1 hypothetical protein D7V20_07485 [Acinetobacter rongchengensis]